VIAARESARRMACRNNLKQVGIAVQSYGALHDYAPPILPDSPPQDAFFPLSPLARMLVELDQQPLHDSINFVPIPTLGAGLQANQTAMMTTLSLFLCPADAADGPVGYGRVSYRFNTGPGPTYFATDGYQIYQGQGTGPFTAPAIHRLSSFTDGLSQTAGVSERIQGDWMRGTFTLGDYTLSTTLPVWNNTAPMTIAQGVAICAEAPPDAPVESRSGESWFLSGYHFTNYNHCITPNSKVRDCSFFPFVEGIHDRTLHQGVFTARSHHDGGVNLLFMDGSARFIADGISLSVWRAIATRNGGEVLSSIE
jgi:prepilin-type processing-associated H-X9-DG protein